jgi:hypothetical protein
MFLFLINQESSKQSSAHFFLGLLFYPGERSDKFLRNVGGLLPNYTVLELKNIVFFIFIAMRASNQTHKKVYSPKKEGEICLQYSLYYPRLHV